MQVLVAERHTAKVFWPRILTSSFKSCQVVYKDKYVSWQGDKLN